MINGEMAKRPSPMYFWSFETGKIFDNNAVAYVEPPLQEGTTPLVKMMGDKYTRTFRNFHYPEISEDHTGGPRTMIDNDYKLVLDAGGPNDSVIELFDLKKDPAESENLASSNPEIVEAMQKQLREWQQSVLTSLTGADYK